MYRPFVHVERLDVLPDYLRGTCYVSPKLDGTNAVLWWNENSNTLGAGSRKRELTASKDNASFYSWAQSDNEEIIALRKFLSFHPNIIVYGEWGVGKVGAIKSYENASANLWIFDMYDTEFNQYLMPDDIQELAEGWMFSQWVVPFTCVTNPTIERIQEMAENNHFLLPPNVAGEGVVIRNPAYRDSHGHYQIAKYVRPAYHESKGEKPSVPITDMEARIAEDFLTPAELSKAKAKVCLALGSSEFLLDNKHIGYFVNEAFTGAILEEMSAILKKYGNPTINFKVLRRLSGKICRDYLGL